MFEFWYVIGVIIFVLVAPHVGVNIMINKRMAKNATIYASIWVTLAMLLNLILLFSQVKHLAVQISMGLLTVGMAFYAMLTVNDKIHSHTPKEPQKC